MKVLYSVRRCLGNHGKTEHSIAKWPIFESSLSELVCIIILSVKYDRSRLMYARGPSQKNIVTAISNFGREQGTKIHLEEHLQNNKLAKFESLVSRKASEDVYCIVPLAQT